MMSRQELADELQTNIRNLSEFRKELGNGRLCDRKHDRAAMADIGW